jgi:hypothetical protein
MKRNGKKIKLINDKADNKITSKNRGTGAGGSNTNKNGLSYEELTDIKEKCNVKREIDKNTKIVTFDEDDREFVITKQNGFNTYMSTKIRKDIKALHGAKRPDEVIIDEKNKTIFILEKKFQQSSGSKCECIQAYFPKIRNYQKRIPDYKIVYVYCLSEWFKTNCEAEIECFVEDKIPYFWGNSETYKDDIIKFIINYK